MKRTARIFTASLLASIVSVSMAYSFDKKTDIPFPYEKAKQYMGMSCSGNTLKTFLGFTDTFEGKVRVFFKCGNDLSSDTFVLVTTESGREWIYNEDKPNAGIVK